MGTPRGTRILGAALLVSAASCARERARSGPEWLSSAARPVSLAATFDTTATVSKLITAASGGTLTATGSDGTRYRLSLPAGALLSDAVITLAPVATLRGLPLSGGSVAAVHVEPSGLQLMKPATLTIRPSREVPAAEQVAFAYYGNGTDAHRVPLSPDPARIELSLLHFSGYGLGQGPADDPGRQALERASASEARLQSRMAQILDRERNGAHKGDGAAELSAAATEYYDAVLRPLLEAARTDDRVANCCIQRYLGWERTLRMLGIVGEDSNAVAADAGLEQRRTEGGKLADEVMRNALDKGRERAVRACREGHDLNAVAMLLGLERQMQLLGVSDGDDGSKAWDEMRRCFNFTVEFESEFDNRVPHMQLLHGVRAQVRVDLSGDAPGAEDEPLGTGPLRYVRHVTRADAGFMQDNSKPTVLSVFGATSIAGVGEKPGTFAVHGIDWDHNIVQPAGTDCTGRETPDKDRQSDSLVVILQTGVPTDIVRATFKVAPPQTMQNHTWSSLWTRHHEDLQAAEAPSSDDPDQPDPVYRIRLHRTAPGEWRADFTRPDAGRTPGFTLSERGQLIVRHTPR